ncbi:50S ribosomal protein L10 [Wenzhouxiangella sediminis]|uniref:Large ribosomal subunit protein uL10 n=1 Tax=Wenzhouxiangella sediminis TaxID=1792836 RepID=A0A3E1K5H3_9GAMM|nr:50S ribosomal protein L10 [Wenzhouxiangella sediminis]RFF29283.1 50S ribosomal protein L10 [Wenzhouxiangella sediminis]
MALTLEQKKAVVAEVADAAKSAHSAVAAEYRGLTVSDMTELRKKARSEGVFLKVAKNTLVKRAVEGTDFECMSEGLSGPLLFAFSMEDPGAAARLIKDYAKENEKLVARLVAVGAELHDASELDRLAKLPTRDQAIAMLMGVMKAPIEKFVRTLAEPHTKLVRTVAAVRDSKQAA